MTPNPVDDPVEEPTPDHAEQAPEPDPYDPMGASSDDEWADPAEGDVERDADGELIPQAEEAGHLGKVLVTQMPYGTIQKFFGDGTTSNIGFDELAYLFRTHIKKPDLNEHYGGRLTSENVEKDMLPLTPQAYLRAVMTASGINPETVEMYEDGARVEIGEDDAGN